ncbi:MAG: sugar transferase [Corynebacterium sp.]|uniref:sugar transferase n=1 Tax=Corynebacterium sp. TaxID=1720 RepID=UPI0026DA7D7D|nr:sugar transferase [Corynebacterium sp.]MDO5098100.1 sugar transferase [Corynebacterium sp.]
MSTYFSLDDVTGRWFHTTARRKQRSSSAFILVFSDLAVITMTIIVPLCVSLYVQGFSKAEEATLSFAVAAVTLCTTWMILLTLSGAHSSSAVGNRSIPVQKIASATLLTFGLFAIADTIYFDSLPQWLFFATMPSGLLLLICSRMVIQQIGAGLPTTKQRTRNAVVLSASPTTECELAYLQTAQKYGLNLASWIDINHAYNSTSFENYVLTELARHKADTLLVSMLCGLDAQQTQRLKWALEGSNIRLIFILPVNGVATGRMSVRSGVETALLEIKTSRYTGLYFSAKRLFDIVAASLGILLLSPVLAAIAIIIKMDDGGPIFFLQTRVGHNRQPFEMIKFRTMKTDAESQLAALAHSHDAGNEVLFKLKNDPRITAPGRFLRRYSLDELPQLFNVLLGDMTLIGPRPPLPREVAQFEPHVLRKFLVKPGITGLWQTMGRSNLSWEESVKLDLYYVENCSAALDFSILARTFKAVLSKEGAY